MARTPKPYVERNWYVSRAGGRYLKLCPTADGMDEAKRVLRLRLGELEREREAMGGKLAGAVTVSELFALFLEHTEATKDADTFKDYQRWCVEFAKQYGHRPARSVTRADAAAFQVWMLKAEYRVGRQAPRRYKPKTVNHAVIALKRAFGWAAETERLPAGRNPFAGMKPLPADGRKRVMTDAEYARLLAACTDDAFRDVLVFLRHTSARPQDVYTLAWDMVDWDAGMAVLHVHKGSRTARRPKPRVIGLGAAAMDVLRRRRAGAEGSRLAFTNRDGTAWTKDTLGSRMERLCKRAGIGPDDRGEKLVLYSCRHTFLTAAGADPGVPQAMLVELAGHTDPRTTARYLHATRQAVADAGRRVADALTRPAGSD